MTDVTMSEVTAFEPATPDDGRIPVPRSSVEVELHDVCPIRKTPAHVSFRCQERGHRLFDFYSFLDPLDVGKPGAAENWVEMSCPRCKALSIRPITVFRGFREGESGRWLCPECGRFLAEVDAIRGRLTVRCKCGEQRAPVPEAVEALLPLARNFREEGDDGGMQRVATTSP